MRLLITGVCGFVGSTLARAFREARPDHEIWGVDNFIRPGSQTNREPLEKLGVRLVEGDIRTPADLEKIPAVDFVIDAAANPSVLAGVDGQSTSFSVFDHNLIGTLQMLEFCKRHRAGFILLSTSRVYSIPPLAALPVEVHQKAFRPQPGASLPEGLSHAGVGEGFSTAAPVSLYGASKVASEIVALEYGETFGFPVWINRCGVLAGAGQFGRADQGIFAFWINSHLRRRPLKFIGFDGGGHQVRDCLHPRDLLPLLEAQMALGNRLPSAAAADTPGLSPRICNFAGGVGASMSLRQLHDWCDARFGPHPVASDPNPRPFDIAWMVLDASRAVALWDWRPQTSLEPVLAEITRHAEAYPHWLELSTPR